MGKKKKSETAKPATAYLSSANKIAPTNPRMASLLSDASRGNIKIPVFQREYVWNDEQIISLLDSIYQGFPVGSLLLWSTKERLKYERIRIKNIVFLPFPIMIVPLVRFFAQTLKPNAPQLQGLRRWFWHCAFTQRYKAGTNRLVTEDLLKMKELASGQPVFDELNATVDPTMFRKGWRINSTVAKSTICLLAQLDPLSMLSGKAVDLSDTLSAYNAREFHHIYPKGHLGSQGIQFHEANVVANICMLTSSDNNQISDEDPRNYFAQIHSSVRDSVFERALIPVEFRDGSKPYDDFLVARAAALASKAQELIRKG